MKSKLRPLVGLLGGFVAVCGPVFAHHGNSAYANNSIELKQATVTKFTWANPHVLIYFDVKDDKGNLVHWVVESGSPSSLVQTQNTWEKAAIQPGEITTIDIYPAKSGKPVGRLDHIELPDGTTLHDSQLGGDGRTRYNPRTDSSSDAKQ